jgi:hypothetical protein
MKKKNKEKGKLRKKHDKHRQCRRHCQLMVDIMTIQQKRKRATTP